MINTASAMRRMASCLAARALKNLAGIFPMDRFHEGIHIGRGLRAIVHVIGMLVHIEREQRATAGNVGRVVGGPLIDEPLVARRIGEDHPARATALRFADRRKLRAPALDAPEIARYRTREPALGRTAAAQAIEINFMEYHRVHRDELFALQPDRKSVV